MRHKLGNGNVSGLGTSRNQAYSMRGLMCTTHAQKTIKTPSTINSYATHLKSALPSTKICLEFLLPVPSWKFEKFYMAYGSHSG
jgi:hypothetical protein